jgi:hypothetical protein
MLLALEAVPTVAAEGATAAEAAGSVLGGVVAAVAVEVMVLVAPVLSENSIRPGFAS